MRDLGLSSLVRRNLGLVRLGPTAIDLVLNERDSRRRAQLIDLLRGQPRTAAFAHKQQVEVLDVASVPSLAARAFTPEAWHPSVLPDEDMGLAGENDTPRTDGRTDGGQRDAAKLREGLVLMWKRDGRNRDQIRQALNEIGLGLTNQEYTEILARHGLG